ncbi:hypothetical protein HUJ04_006405 [Dendroctonus ponderosae]|nr:hypothetical protein HUJ04_006405 [Dendroctonus ponderosae]
MLTSQKQKRLCGHCLKLVSGRKLENNHLLLGLSYEIWKFIAIHQSKTIMELLLMCIKMTSLSQLSQGGKHPAAVSSIFIFLLLALETLDISG